MKVRSRRSEIATVLSVVSLVALPVAQATESLKDKSDQELLDLIVGPNKVLLAWNEPDPLTKTKLDILLTGYIGSGVPVLEKLRADFKQLSKEDNLAARNFINWLRTNKAPLPLYYIENALTPDTPRPRQLRLD